MNTKKEFKKEIVNILINEYKMDKKVAEWTVKNFLHYDKYILEDGIAMVIYHFEERLFYCWNSQFGRDYLEMTAKCIFSNPTELYEIYDAMVWGKQ